MMRVRDILGNRVITSFVCTVESLSPLIVSCEPRYSHSVTIYFALDTPASAPIIGAHIYSKETARKYLPKVWPWPLPLPTIHGRRICVAGKCSTSNAYYTTASGDIVFVDPWSVYSFIDKIRREAEALLAAPSEPQSL
jgi:hypothetical protein